MRSAGDGADGLYYYDAVVLDRSQRAPPTDTPKARIAAYCTCDQIALFKLLKWLDRPSKDASATAGSYAAGWTNKMYMGVVHSSLAPRQFDDDDTSARVLQQKDAFYFAYVLLGRVYSARSV